MCKWLTFRLILEVDTVREAVCALGDANAPYWASWLNVPQLSTYATPQYPTPSYGSAVAASAQAGRDAGRGQHFNSVATTIGELAALLWPAAAQAPGPQPGKTMWIPEPDSPRTIAWSEESAAAQKQQLLAQMQTMDPQQLQQLQQQLAQQQMCPPQQRWGVAPGMVVR